MNAVKIPALALVALMHTAMWSIIRQFVPVKRASPVIHSLVVIRNVRTKKKSRLRAHINSFSPLFNCAAFDKPDERLTPCIPSPCGPNAECKERDGAGSCTCLPEYFGDPYSGCRPECVTNSDCSRDKSCVNNKCSDPCPGVCGLNAECRVGNHVPTCLCHQGYTGNALSACREIPELPPPSMSAVHRLIHFKIK